MPCRFTPDLHTVPQMYVHTETCSNVKVQKGAVKCYPKKKSIFLWVLFVAKVAFLNRLIIVHNKVTITRISSVWKAYRCCQSVSLSVVEVMFVLSISMYFCPWMEPWNMLHIWKESKSGNFFQIYLGRSYMKHFWKNSSFANHLWFSCCALLSTTFLEKAKWKECWG